MNTTITKPESPTVAVPLKMPEIAVVETDRDRFAQNRERVCETLRGTGVKQIRGALRDARGGRCFVGLAAEVIE